MYECMDNRSDTWLEINDNYILVEEVGDDYVHNTNGKGFFNILKTGKLEGKIQKDKI